MDGQGRLSMPDGSVFEGQFQNGKFHGHGVYCWSDGSKYEGMQVYINYLLSVDMSVWTSTAGSYLNKVHSKTIGQTVKVNTTMWKIVKIGLVNFIPKEHFS